MIDGTVYSCCAVALVVSNILATSGAVDDGFGWGAVATNITGIGACVVLVGLCFFRTLPSIANDTKEAVVESSKVFAETVQVMQEAQKMQAETFVSAITENRTSLERMESENRNAIDRMGEQLHGVQLEIAKGSS